MLKLTLRRKQMIKAILFDLDGTLLKMDQEIFIKAYFAGLAKKLAPYGYDPQGLVKAVYQGTMAMQANDGKGTNEEIFWTEFEKLLGGEVKKHIDVFEDFYLKEFQLVENVCEKSKGAQKAVASLKDKFILALATNPVFPKIATQSRIRWAGLEEKNFALVTTYETDRFCKPTKEYYLSVAQRIGVKPEECLMVGNDVDDDMPAKDVGMKVFLLTDCLINKTGVDISVYPNGNFDDLLMYIQKNS